MKIQELMESYIADALPDVIHHAKDLIILYTQTLPEIVKKYDFSVNDPYDPNELGVANRDINACKLQIGSARSMWFVNNYLSVHKNRADKGMGGGKSARGLKTALDTLSRVPSLQRIDLLKKLAHLSLNINPNNKVNATVAQRVQGTAPPEANIKAYGELMGDVEECLPDIIKQIAKVAKPHEVETTFLSAEEIYNIGVKLDHAINKWYSLKGTIPKLYQGATKFKQKGDALVGVNPNKDLGKSDIVRPEEKPKKQDTHSQNMSQVDMIINHGLSQLDPKIAHEIRTTIARSDNKLLAMQQELAKRNIKLEESFRRMLKKGL